MTIPPDYASIAVDMIKMQIEVEKLSTNVNQVIPTATAVNGLAALWEEYVLATNDTHHGHSSQMNNDQDRSAVVSSLSDKKTKRKVKIDLEIQPQQGRNTKFKQEKQPYNQQAVASSYDQQPFLLADELESPDDPIIFL